MPSGGIFAFDELNQARGAGETLVLKQSLGLKNVKLKKFFFDPHVTFYGQEWYSFRSASIENKKILFSVYLFMSALEFRRASHNSSWCSMGR